MSIIADMYKSINKIGWC